MKRSILFFLLLIAALALSSCTSAESTPTPPTLVEPNVIVESTDLPTNPEEIIREAINFNYEGALSTRLLLAFGTLKLAETNFPVTSAQAPQLLLLWRALDNLTKSGTSAEAEVAALLSEIELTLSSEQIQSINAMQLTQESIQAWVQANGITVGSGTGTGLGSGQGQGQGSSLSPEEKATRQAAEGMTGNTAAGESGLSSVITTALIAYLEGLE